MQELEDEWQNVVQVFQNVDKMEICNPESALDGALRIR